MKRAVLILVFLSLFMEGFSQIVRKKIPDKLVVFTFDDATASQFAFVAPELKKYDFHATFFVCEFPPNFSDSTKYMNWRQIKELDRMGFEVANHSQSHPAMSKLTEEQMKFQIKYIERKCDSMKIPLPVSFAYPGYNLNKTLLNILEQKGYRFGRAGGNKAYDPVTDHPLLIPSWAMVGSNRDQIYEAFNNAKDGKIVVITIHGVPDVEHPWVTTPPELFSEYLRYLSENHYKVLALRDLNKYVRYRRAMKRRDL